MSLPTGTRVDRYQVLSLIGAGGMGEIYLAKDTRLDRPVALKLLPEEFTENAERLRRFEQEARTVSALNHENILTVHDIGEDGGRHFIATEFIEGETLRAALARGPLPTCDALRVAAQVAAALAAAHSKGIVHRDIKPDNIMVRRGGHVKVLDFGIAKLSARAPARREAGPDALTLPKTKPRVVFGTARYMSPEQARGLAVDERTDIFSLGVVLYEMIAGRPPFDGATEYHVTVSILDHQPEPLFAHEPQPSAELRELRRIVSKALEKETAGRYQTVEDMAGDLVRLRRRLDALAELGQAADGGAAADAGTAAPPSDTGAEAPAPRMGRVVAYARRHKRGAALFVAVALAVVGYGLYRFVGWSQAEPRVIVSRKYVAYVSDNESSQSISVREIGVAGEPRHVKTAPRISDVQFSADGNELYCVIYELQGAFYGDTSKGAFHRFVFLPGGGIKEEIVWSEIDMTRLPRFVIQ